MRRARTSRPSRCTCAPSRSVSSNWGHYILSQPNASTTWRISAMRRARTSRPNRCTSAPSRSMNGSWDHCTLIHSSCEEIMLLFCAGWDVMQRQERLKRSTCHHNDGCKNSFYRYIWPSRFQFWQCLHSFLFNCWRIEHTSYRTRANRSVARTISWAIPGVSGAWPALSTITTSARGHTRLSSHAFAMGA